MRKSLLVATLGVVFGFLCLCAGQLWVFEIPFHLAVGWFVHIIHVAPRITFSVGGIGVFVVALPIVLLLSQNAARWLWSGLGREGDWRWRWTFAAVGCVILMFCAGIAATGVVHQTGWLLRSPQPLTVSNWQTKFEAQRDACQNNLHQIAQALAIYAAHHDGARPAGRADIVSAVAAEGGRPEWFVCSNGIAEAASTSGHAADWTSLVVTNDHYCSYQFFDPPTPGPDATRRVMLADNEAHSYAGFGGLNLLYDDGTIEVLDIDAAQRWTEAHPVTRLEPATR